jgi:hypothetical protein
MRRAALAIIVAAIVGADGSMQAAFAADGVRVIPQKKTVRPAHRVRSKCPYPVACEAVKFPRSPLCEGRPFRPSPYGAWIY